MKDSTLHYYVPAAACAILGLIAFNSGSLGYSLIFMLAAATFYTLDRDTV